MSLSLPALHVLTWFPWRTARLIGDQQTSHAGCRIRRSCKRSQGLVFNVSAITVNTIDLLLVSCRYFANKQHLSSVNSGCLAWRLLDKNALQMVSRAFPSFCKHF
ncbi:hypothetical protein B0T12DRAFT_411687 [Alternaria alternata]|nr:hypothetical protein B0T12DRAFT_411687 [Alternaria alternata]